MSFQGRAENFYLRAGATGSETGLTWNDAWSSFAKIKWGAGGGRLGVGDKLWVAGGIYGKVDLGSVAVASGTVSILRASANSPESTAAAGWSRAFDAQVVLEITDFGQNAGKFDIQFRNDWFVRPNSSGYINGRDWQNAWSLSSLNWKFINPGDTVWLAGGSYTNSLVVGRSGTATNPITIKRVVLTDSVTNVLGWNSGLATQAIITSFSPLRVGFTNVLIDGRVDMGLRLNVLNVAGIPASADLTGSSRVTLTNIDFVGPNAAAFPDGTSCSNALVNFNGDSSGVMVGYGYGQNPGAEYLTISHSRVRGHANEFWLANVHNMTVEHCKIYDNGAANSEVWHGNVFIINGSDGVVFRFNEVYNWQVEGLYPWGSVSKNWYVYGNIFRDGLGGTNGSAHRFLELRSFSSPITHGPLFVYNNTIVNCWAAITRGDTSVFWSSDSIVRNNLIWNVTGGGIGYLPATADHNFSDGNSGGGVGSISNGSQPFVNFAGGDFRISTAVNFNLPRNKGVALANVAGQLLEVDREGTVRGSDGTWDIGAFEAVTP